MPAPSDIPIGITNPSGPSGTPQVRPGPPGWLWVNDPTNGWQLVSDREFTNRDLGPQWANVGIAQQRLAQDLALQQAQTAESARQFNERFGADKARFNIEMQHQQAVQKWREATDARDFQSAEFWRARAQELQQNRLTFDYTQFLGNLRRGPQDWVRYWYLSRGLTPPAGAEAIPLEQAIPAWAQPFTPGSFIPPSLQPPQTQSTAPPGTPAAPPAAPPPAAAVAPPAAKTPPRDLGLQVGGKRVSLEDYERAAAEAQRKFLAGRAGGGGPQTGGGGRGVNYPDIEQRRLEAAAAAGRVPAWAQPAFQSGFAGGTARFRESRDTGEIRQPTLGEETRIPALDFRFAVPPAFGQQPLIRLRQPTERERRTQ